MYAAGQDILKDAFSGNIRGMGPGAAEMEFVERGAEPIVFFMADKTEPSAYSMPSVQDLHGPVHHHRAGHRPEGARGFQASRSWTSWTPRRSSCPPPRRSYDILSLLGDTTRYAIKRIFSKNKDIGIAAVVSTEKLNLCAGKYVGKDDPVCRRQMPERPPRGRRGAPALHVPRTGGRLDARLALSVHGIPARSTIPTRPTSTVRHAICALGFQISNGKLQGCEDPGSAARRARAGGLSSPEALGRGPQEGGQGQHLHAPARAVHARHPRTGGDGVHHPSGRPRQAEGQDGED